MSAAAIAALVLSLVSAFPGLQTGTLPEDVTIALERTSCFGDCPIYRVTIDARGNVIYEGRKFVAVSGRRTGRIPVARVAAILATADRIGFFELRDHYRTVRGPDGSETVVTDLPTTIVTITRAGVTKRVEDYYGAPRALQELERQIDEAAGTSQWVERKSPVR